jgi:hypothetical protein
LADVKNGLQIEDILDDTAIEAAILTASRQIDEYCQRFFYREGTVASPSVRYYTALNPWNLETDDIVQITEVATDTGFQTPLQYSQVWNLSSDIMLEPVNNPKKGWPITRILAVGQYVWPYFFPTNM